MNKRINDLASNHTLWGSEYEALSNLERPLVPTEREFLSSYVLIGNIDPSSHLPPLPTTSLQTMIRKVVSDSLPDCSVDEDFFKGIFMDKFKHLRPGNLGLADSNLHGSQTQQTSPCWHNVRGRGAYLPKNMCYG